MLFKSTKGRLLAAAIFVSLPTAAIAQEVEDRANEVAEQAEELAQEANALTEDVAQAQGEGDAANGIDAGDDREDRGDDDSGKWGLLGLLGLAGLLGLKRRDDHRDVHVDSRRDNTRV